MSILILTEKDMRSVFPMRDAIEAAKDALVMYSAGKTNIPLRANLNVPEFEGQSLYMYGYAAPEQALGVKIVSVYPNNIEKGMTSVPATMVLLDAKTGSVCCIMDGTWLTRLRTGAVAGAASDVLSRRDAETFALFGAGGQAETQLEAVLSVRPIKRVRVYDTMSGRAADFAEKMQEKFGASFSVTIEASPNPDDALKDADIITAVTTSAKAVFDGKLVKKSAHINGVGSYTPDMAEIDPSILKQAAVVAVDTRDGAVQESGDLLGPIRDGFLKEMDCAELGEILAGTRSGRTSDEELTFFETTGSAVLDLVTAQRIYRFAMERGIGQIVPM